MNTYITILALFAVVVVLWSMYMNTSPVGYFTNTLPKERFQDIVNEFGYPDYVVNTPGGIAVWRNKDYYTELVLKDESIEHLKPKAHCDFFYATVNVYIPSDRVSDVLSLSESVYYDQLKRELTARCHFMGANVATLFLAMTIVNDPDNVGTYRSQYGDTIMSTLNNDVYTRMYDGLGKLVVSNQTVYANNMANKNCLIQA